MLIVCETRRMVVAQAEDFPTMSELLALRGLDQTALAVLGGIDPASASRITRGLQEPRPETILRMARGLGMSPIRLRRIIQRTQQVARLQAAGAP